MSHFIIRKAVAVKPLAASLARTFVLPTGFPFLMRLVDGTVEHEPTLFLRKLCLGGGSPQHLIVSPLTALARAYDLKDFAEFLAHVGITYADLSADALYRYASTMANRISPVTHEIYSHLTIAKRCWIAVEFAAWVAAKEGFPNVRRQQIEALRRSGVKGRRATHRPEGWKRPTLLPTKFKLHEPRILDDSEARRLLREIRRVDGGLENESVDSASVAIGRRNYLMAKVAICTGLRREEICRLPRGPVELIALGNSSRALHPILITHTKNSVQRKVLFPASLISELQRYSSNERAGICANHCDARCGMQGPLFPSGRAAPSGRCVPMCPQNLSLIVRKGAERAGILRRRSHNEVDKSPRNEFIADVSTHDLRHTYAVWTYLILKADGDPNPWLFIQSQLGHRSSETTISVYLKMATMFESSLGEALAGYVRSLSDAVNDDPSGT